MDGEYIADATGTAERGAPEEMPPGSYWEAQAPIGDVPLSEHSKVAVSMVRKDGEKYLRQRAYRRAAHGAKHEWTAARQIMIFPPSALPALRELLAAAEAAVGVPSDGLTQAEVDGEGVCELPDREALSLLIPASGDMIASSVAAVEQDNPSD